MILYLISPYINKLLKTLKKAEYMNLLLLCGFLWFILAFITTTKLQRNDLLYLTYLYSIGGYIKLYKDNWKFDKKKNIILILGLIVLTYSIVLLLKLISVKISIVDEYATIFYNQKSPFLLLISIFTFILFKDLNIDSKLINTLASTTFGVYLIHESKLVYPILWTNIFHCNNYIKSPYFIIYSLIVCLIVYIVCTLIELIRINLLEKNYMKIIFKIEPFINKVLEKYSK